MDTYISVAIAEDHRMFRDTIVHFVSSINPKIDFVIQASNGKELCEQLSLTRSLPDVILLDISMPVMNGYQTTEYIKKRWKNIKILAFSMYIDEFPIINILRLGASGFIEKSCAPLELNKAIISMFQRGFYYSDHAERTFTNHGIEKSKNVPFLTTRDLEFLFFSFSEMTYKEISVEMRITSRAVEYYRERLFRKLNVQSRLGLAIFALRAGLIVNDYSNET